MGQSGPPEARCAPWASPRWPGCCLGQGRDSVGELAARHDFLSAARGGWGPWGMPTTTAAEWYSIYSNGTSCAGLGRGRISAARAAILAGGPFPRQADCDTMVSLSTDLWDGATMNRVPPVELDRFCQAALRKCNLSEEHARLAADVLVTTDTFGVYTHGTKSLKGYVRRILAGGLKADAMPEVIAEGPAWAIVDGHSAIGMVTSVLAMNTAIRKAKGAGVAYVGVRNSCHFGAAGYYATLAAKAGMIGMAMANDTPSMAVPGSRAGVLGTNPFAYAVPAGDEEPIFLDIASSAVAGGKIRIAQAQGRKVPDTWLVDAEGVPTDRSFRLSPRRRIVAVCRPQGLRYRRDDREPLRRAERGGNDVGRGKLDRRRSRIADAARGGLPGHGRRGDDADGRLPEPHRPFDPRGAPVPEGQGSRADLLAGRDGMAAPPRGPGSRHPPSRRRAGQPPRTGRAA